MSTGLRSKGKEKEVEAIHIVEEIEEEEEEEVSEPISVSSSSTTTEPIKLGISGGKRRAPGVASSTHILRLVFQGSPIDVSLVQLGRRWINRYGSKAQVIEGYAYLYGKKTRAAMLNAKNSASAQRLKIAAQYGKGELTVIQAANKIAAIPKNDGDSLDNKSIANMLARAKEVGNLRGTGKAAKIKKKRKDLLDSLDGMAKKDAFITLRNAGYTSIGAAGMVFRLSKVHVSQDERLAWDKDVQGGAAPISVGLNRRKAKSMKGRKVV